MTTQIIKMPERKIMMHKKMTRMHKRAAEPLSQHPSQYQENHHVVSEYAR